jgi:hypothetical protein
LAGVSVQATPLDPLSGFRQRVAAYVELKAAIAATLPPRRQARSFEEFITLNDRLRFGLQRARRDVRRGNVFVGESRPALRELLAWTLDDHGLSAADFVDDMDRDRLPGAAKVRINERFPYRQGVIAFPCLLESLPGLPRELEYRIDGRDLVLVDVEVNLVLDVLKNAFAAK